MIPENSSNQSVTTNPSSTSPRWSIKTSMSRRSPHQRVRAIKAPAMIEPVDITELRDLDKLDHRRSSSITEGVARSPKRLLTGVQLGRLGRVDAGLPQRVLEHLCPGAVVLRVLDRLRDELA